MNFLSKLFMNNNEEKNKNTDKNSKLRNDKNYNESVQNLVDRKSVV